MTTTITIQAFAETAAPENGILIQTTTINEVEWGSPGETTEDVQTDVIPEEVTDLSAFQAALDAAGWQIVDNSLDESSGSMMAIVERKN